MRAARLTSRLLSPVAFALFAAIAAVAEHEQLARDLAIAAAVILAANLVARHHRRT